MAKTTTTKNPKTTAPEGLTIDVVRDNVVAGIQWVAIGSIAVTKTDSLPVEARQEYLDTLKTNEDRASAIRLALGEGPDKNGPLFLNLSKMFRFQDTPAYRDWIFRNKGNADDVAFTSRITRWERMKRAVVLAAQTAKKQTVK